MTSIKPGSSTFLGQELNRGQFSKLKKSLNELGPGEWGLVLQKNGRQIGHVYTNKEDVISIVPEYGKPGRLNYDEKGRLQRVLNRDKSLKENSTEVYNFLKKLLNQAKKVAYRL